MYETFYLYFFITNRIFSCISNHNEVHVENFSETKHLVAEFIHIPNVIEPEFSTITNKYFILSSSKSDTVIHFYNLPDLTHYKSEGIKGQGSGDFQSFPMFCQTSAKNSLYIWGYTPLNIKKYIVSEYGDVNYEKEFTLTLRESFNQMHIIRDSLLVYSAIPSEFYIKKYDLIHNEYIGEIQLKKDNHPESFFYSNRGVIAANDSLIMYAYVYKKEIDIYDLETMKLKTKIVGDYKPQYIVVGDFEANIHHYIRIVAGKKYVYALHAETNNLNQDKTSLEVYDFHWNPVIRYTFDIVPYLFEIDEENGFIIGHNNEYEDYFLRYKI